ncbi:MAG: YqaA family protein [Cellvibrionaceae bacterium]
MTLLNQGEHSHLVIGLVATLGNTLGAVFNWGLGRYLLHFQQKKWFPFSQEKLVSSQVWFQRYGQWSLLFSWLPMVGDAFTFIAGTMRVKLITLIVLCGIGKGLRYAVLIMFADRYLSQLS